MAISRIPTARAEKAVEAADESRRKSLKADHHHRAVERCVEGHEHAGDGSGERGEPPGHREDGMQVDPALRGKQRALSRGPHPDAPAAKTKEGEQSAIHDRHQADEKEREQRNPRIPEHRQRDIGKVKNLRRMLRLSRPDQHDHPLDQDTDRDRRQHGREDAAARHLPHQHMIGRETDDDAQRGRHEDCNQRIGRDARRRREERVGAEHHQFAMRHVEHAADAVDEDISARHQRIERGKHNNVDEELGAHLAGSARGDVVFDPVFLGDDLVLGLVPLVDAVVLRRAEMVVRREFDRDRREGLSYPPSGSASRIEFLSAFAFGPAALSRASIVSPAIQPSAIWFAATDEPADFAVSAISRWIGKLS